MNSVLHRNLRHSLPTASKGEGVYLKDSEGKLYIDASGGAGVSSLGHRSAVVNNAIWQQLNQLECAHTSFFTNSPCESLASRLVERAPTDFGQGRVIFINSGSEAMEVALKLARQFHVERGELTRTHFISRRQSYHGNTLGALAVSGNLRRRQIYQPMLMPTSQIAPCYAYRHQHSNESEVAYAQRCALDLETEINHLGAENVAAFIAEPVSGATLGCATAPQTYFAEIRRICDRYGVLMIADEVMCGMGRTGHWFAMSGEVDIEDSSSATNPVCPDIITLAKGLGAGYQPIAATMASEKVVSVIEKGSGQLANGHTYMSHAVACAAALAVVDEITQRDLLHEVNVMGRYIQALLAATFAEHPYVGDIRGRGLFWGIELVKDKVTKVPFAAELQIAPMIKQVAMQNGLICYPAQGCVDGIAGDHILLAPPFIINTEQINEVVDKLQISLKACLVNKNLM
ncbi:aspartate aminotransferase family protein [Aliikangiella maris]|uniref:Aspartate aminotransferase family protein n=2 Tax=Aliikangiella maris TaxID=3162458 RepID=A0ABV2BVC8_9GAMM